MVQIGGKEYWKLVGYFQGRTMECLETKYGVVPGEIEEYIIECDDLIMVNAYYDMSLRTKGLKEFQESMMKIYE